MKGIKGLLFAFVCVLSLVFTTSCDKNDRDERQCAWEKHAYWKEMWNGAPICACEEGYRAIYTEPDKTSDRMGYTQEWVQVLVKRDNGFNYSSCFRCVSVESTDTMPKL